MNHAYFSKWKKTTFLILKICKHKNTAVKTTKDSIELVPYSDIDGLVWEKQVIKRDFKPAPESDGEFKTFLWKVAGDTDTDCSGHLHPSPNSCLP